MSNTPTNPMTAKERLFHAVLFEIGAIGLTVAVFALLGDNHSPTHATGLAVAISVLAVVWNMVFNFLFDKVVTGERLDRSLGTRLVHMGLFEGGLFLATVPMIAYALDVSLWTAFVMDIGVVAVIGVYTLLFNWGYDWVRFFIVRNNT